MTMQHQKIYGLISESDGQKPLIENHCFGDCGKISMAGAIFDENIGGLFVCCEHVCPYLDKQTDRPFGTSRFGGVGPLHDVYLRVIKDERAEAKVPK